MKAAKEGTRI